MQTFERSNNSGKIETAALLLLLSSITLIAFDDGPPKPVLHPVPIDKIKQVDPSKGDLNIITEGNLKFIENRDMIVRIPSVSLIKSGGTTMPVINYTQVQVYSGVYSLTDQSGNEVTVLSNSSNRLNEGHSKISGLLAKQEDGRIVISNAEQYKVE